MWLPVLMLSEEGGRALFYSACLAQRTTSRSSAVFILPVGVLFCYPSLKSPKYVQIFLIVCSKKASCNLPPAPSIWQITIWKLFHGTLNNASVTFPSGLDEKCPPNRRKLFSRDNITKCVLDGKVVLVQLHTCHPLSHKKLCGYAKEDFYLPVKFNHHWICNVENLKYHFKYH